eukprot:comp23135_c0_seq1/m.37322 comp23135_c0_seq1/g.37322  ORF comp23135_c0_seq1/g.37322 comp23135_c0_seq1/m.37322 type:complete len:184 (-) comp23135_c0_seq1:806-1357(-)
MYKNPTNTYKMEPQIQPSLLQDHKTFRELSPLLLDFLPAVSELPQPRVCVNEYTASNQKILLQELSRQLLETGTAQVQLLDQMERVLFVESATAMLMADVQDYGDLGHVLQNLKSLHVSIIATFMPYPAYHAQARKWINDFFKKNPVYCRWLEACEEAAQSKNTTRPNSRSSDSPTSTMTPPP